MRKNVFVVGMAVMVLAFVVVFVACSSAPPFVYDDTVPPEQSSTLIINGCQVNKFNGTKVSAGVNADKWNAAATGDKTVIIPAGEHTLDLWNTGDGGIGNVEVTNTFLPGHTYLVFAPVDGRTITGIIIDKAIYNSDLVPDPSSPDASPIEGRWNFSSDGKTKDELIFAKNEYARMINGTYVWRGFINFNGNTITLPAWAYYMKGEWKVIPPTREGIKLTYNGTKLFWGKYEGKKVE